MEPGDPLPVSAATKPISGEMAALIRAKDWSATPLGPREGWDPNLLLLTDVLLEHPLPAVILWGPQLVQIYNDGYRAVAGGKHPVALGQPTFECWPEVKATTVPLYDRVLAGEALSIPDLPMQLARSGELAEVFITVGFGPLRDARGRIAGILVLLTETTGKVLAERAAKQANERLSLALAGADLGTWEWDPQTDLIEISDRTADLYGLAHRIRITRTQMRALFDPGYAAVAKQALERAMREKVDYDMEYRVTRPDGTKVWIAAKGRGILDAAGNVTRMLGVVQDITPRKVAEEDREMLLRKVQGESARLSAAFHVSPAFMCVLRGPDHVFEYANERYLQLIGHTDILGKSVVGVLPEVAAQGYVALLDGVYRERVPFIGRDMRLSFQASPNATRVDRFVDFVYQPIVESDGSVTGIFVHGIDITENKRVMQDRERLLESERVARTEAERANRMKDDFLATVSHELRTPLGAILGWTQVLRDTEEATPGLLAGLDTIERNARAQAKIVEDLLDMSRIISGKVRLDVQPLDITKIIRAAIETVQAAADTRGVRLIAVLDPLVGEVKGDPNRLQQVLWNLLSNAVKFTPKGGRIQVALQRVNSHLEISVNDSGEGIAPEFLPFVFDRFRQMDSSITRRHGGLGLGLSIVKQLVDLHGGSAHVSSPGLGKGSTFTVSLPFVVLHPESRPEERRHPRALSGAPSKAPDTDLKDLRVLAVDDDPDARALLKRLLEDRGAAVATAGSVSEGLDLLDRQTFDVLVSDIGMPDEDGYAFIRRVRARPAGKGNDLPALALTAYARSEDRMQAIAAGFQMHLSKPVETAELVIMLASLARYRTKAY
jgi:PAS domain S-box-containing protein